MATYAPPVDATPTSRVELHISCQQLIDLDAFSKSDPMVLCFEQLGNTWVERGRTEMIRDNLNPKFVTPIVLDYRFETLQNLRFVCYDIDDPKSNLTHQDYIGEMGLHYFIFIDGTNTCKLSDFFTCRNQIFTKQLVHPAHPHSKRGYITINAEEMRSINDVVKFQLIGSNLDKKDFFGKSDPYLQISRAQGDKWVVVFKTEVIKNTLDPSWKPFALNVSTICNGDYQRPLLFECFDWNKTLSHELIGSFKTTLGAITTDARTFELVDEQKKQKKKGYRNSGIIKVLDCQLIKQSSFLDYIIGGCEMNLIVAIDFTASNGNPVDPNSLHNISNGRPNEYVQAITTVGEILSEYDSDKMFPVYGFGADLPPGNRVSHCFPLNGNPQQPEVPGVQGILDSYYQALRTVRLYGPTLFSEILKASMFIANQNISQQNQKYFILLILTDGVINDMDATIDLIVEASSLPLSIVIVGVGQADFENMKILDADDVPLRSRNGRLMTRDIVQFVPFRNFKNQPLSVLAKETLAEIPAQLIGFMQSRAWAPNKPVNIAPVQPSMSAPVQASAPAPSPAPPRSSPERQNSNLNYPQFSSLSQIQLQIPGAPPGPIQQPPPQQAPPATIPYSSQAPQQPQQPQPGVVYGQPASPTFSVQQPPTSPQPNQPSQPTQTSSYSTQTNTTQQPNLRPTSVYSPNQPTPSYASQPNQPAQPTGPYGAQPTQSTPSYPQSNQQTPPYTAQPGQSPYASQINQIPSFTSQTNQQTNQPTQTQSASYTPQTNQPAQPYASQTNQPMQSTPYAPPTNQPASAQPYAPQSNQQPYASQTQPYNSQQPTQGANIPTTPRNSQQYAQTPYQPQQPTYPPSQPAQSQQQQPQVPPPLTQQGSFYAQQPTYPPSQPAQSQQQQQPPPLTQQGSFYSQQPIYPPSQPAQSQQQQQPQAPPPLTQQGSFYAQQPTYPPSQPAQSQQQQPPPPLTQQGSFYAFAPPTSTQQPNQQAPYQYVAQQYQQQPGGVYPPPQQPTGYPPYPSQPQQQGFPQQQSQQPGFSQQQSQQGYTQPATPRPASYPPPQQYNPSFRP